MSENARASRTARAEVRATRTARAGRFDPRESLQGEIIGLSTMPVCLLFANKEPTRLSI